ncbi:hypothetical protein [Nonomuraea sp. B19D2]|uniref:hypothetical protein n=1 Tax=Nonomuraea sp. B19D2 TaxID=3159561 RepID=UPI0032DB70CE
MRAVYGTSYLQIWTVVDSNGARWGCGTDSTFFSRIDVFKLCEGDKYGPCRTPVRIGWH